MGPFGSPKESAELPSRAGDGGLTLRRLARDDAGLRLEAEIVGCGWTAADASGPVEDFRVALRLLGSREDSLAAARDALTGWLDEPRDLVVELASLDGRLLTLRLGVRDDVISRVERPAATLAYSGARMPRGEWWFVVDQSCVRLFRDGLTRLLARQG